VPFEITLPVASVTWILGLMLCTTVPTIGIMIGAAAGSLVANTFSVRPDTV
jgi:uncharacterized membrane protein